MTNIGEPLINIVTANKLKVLTSLSQKARSGLLPSKVGHTDTIATGGQAGSNPSVLTMRNVVSPYLCPSGQANRKECCWGCG